MSAFLWDVVSEILSRLQWVDGVTIQSDRLSVATLFLWATRLEIAKEPWRFPGEPRDILHRLLATSDQVHLSDPQLAVIYANVLLGCIDANGDQVTERPALEWVARAASICMLRALSVVDPKAMVDEGKFDHYLEVLPPSANFQGRLCRHTMSTIHTLLLGSRGRWFDWVGYKPRSPEYAPFARALAQVARPREPQTIFKVPRWVLRFVLHSLSQNTPPPAPVTIACLSIVAIDLGCDIPSTNDLVPERYVYTPSYVYLSNLGSVPS